MRQRRGKKSKGRRKAAAIGVDADVADAETKSTTADSARSPERPIEIRSLRLEDIPAVYALGARLFTADEWTTLYRTWDEYDLLHLFIEDAEACLVAVDDRKRLQGFILGSVIEKRGTAWRYGWIVWLGVRPRAKGRGIASKLLSSLTDVFVERGVRLLLADTQVSNQGAVRFFTKHGFGRPQEHVFLEKNISSEQNNDDG